MAERIRVAETTAIASGTAICVDLNGKKIALFNLNGEFYAIDDACTHRGGPLSEGPIDGCIVTCPWHAAAFDIKTGEASRSPATRAVATYRVYIEGTDIHIELP